MKFSKLSRSSFLAIGLGAGIAPTSVAAAEQTKMFSPTEVADIKRLAAAVPFHFDRARFEAILAAPAPHRQVVVATSYSAVGTALSHIRNSIKAYADPLGFDAGPHGLRAAAVFYGGYAYAAALDDAMWQKYPIGPLVMEELHPGDAAFAETAKTLKTNLVAPIYRALVVEEDVSFFICNNALSGFVYQIANAAAHGAAITRETVVAMHDEFVAHFLPGTMLVPAGVAALNAAQEARYTFLPE